MASVLSVERSGRANATHIRGGSRGATQRGADDNGPDIDDAAPAQCASAALRETPHARKRCLARPRARVLAERWTAALKTLDVPGFAVAVVKDGAVLALDGFGVRNVAGDRATPDTCYYIASATKPFTAMAACLLAAEDAVELDEPVLEYLPQLELRDPELTQSLTLRDLLCHRPGLESGPIVHRDAYSGQISDALYFTLLRDAEIAYQVRYSNVHFTLAARVLEAVSGKKWQDLLAERLFAPLGMSRTTAYASAMYGEGEHADPMLRVDGAWTRSPLRKTDRTMHAAGGIGTTARDAARWLLVNTGCGALDGRQLLPKEIANEYFSQQSAHPRPSGRIRIEEGFALGWNIGKYRERTRPYLFHGGGYVGAASYFCFLPVERIGVAVLVNTGEGGADLATLVSIDVLDRLLGVTGQPDLLPTYEDGARKRRESARPRPSGANPARAADGLTKAPEQYAGTYTHPLEGELEVLLEQGALRARNGDLPYALVSTGPDAFTAWVVPGMTATGRFELDSGGAVVAVELTADKVTNRFRRAGAQK